ncbi:MAG: hypothetical protein Q7J42_00355 [Sulfuritalea sp.]|nr:hypothetical protein [Sulfuritalea sp.]
MRPWAARAEFGLVFLLGFLLWLLNHPYQGIWHDARIYGLLAAHWLNPQALAGDLFFSFGSQGELSVFTPLFGELVRWLGLSRAAWWVTLGGGLMWIGACLVLARAMLGTGFAARFAVFLGAVVIISYSPNGSTFVIGENFATARSWAIPLGLVSVAAMAVQRQGWALAMSLAATALHPLHGIWPLALWVLARLRTPLALSLALLPVAVVALLGVTNPDLPHLRLMTGDWLDFAWNSAPDIVFKAPLHTRLPQYSGVLILLWLAARMGSEEWRALYLRLLLLGVGGLGLALIASYLFPIEIVVQGQPWRVMALLIPLAAVAILDLARRVWHSSAAGRLLVGVVAVLASMGFNWLLGALCALGLASLIPGCRIGRIEAWVGQWRLWLGGALAVFALAAVPNVLAGWEIAGGQLMNPWWAGAELLHGLVAGNSWHLAAVLALALGWLGGDASAVAGRKWLLVIPVLAAAGLVTLATLGTWDRRSEQYRIEQACYIDTSCPPHPFRQWIVPGGTVFWPQRELTVWFEIGTASYFGEIQATGRLFSAEKFYEGQRRQAWVAVGTDPRHLCADPILDWVVLPYSVPELTVQAVSRNAYLYACATLRAVPDSVCRGFRCTGRQVPTPGKAVQ